MTARVLQMPALEPLTPAFDTTRRRIVRTARLAQDAHSANEEKVYRHLWTNSRQVASTWRVIPIGVGRLARELNLSENCARAIQRSLERKLAIQKIADYNCEAGTPRSFRIYSQKEILTRRRAAGLTRYRKFGSAIEFVGANGEKVFQLDEKEPCAEQKTSADSVPASKCAPPANLGAANCAPLPYREKSVIEKLTTSASPGVSEEQPICVAADAEVSLKTDLQEGSCDRRKWILRFNGLLSAPLRGKAVHTIGELLRANGVSWGRFFVGFRRNRGNLNQIGGLIDFAQNWGAYTEDIEHWPKCYDCEDTGALDEPSSPFDAKLPCNCSAGQKTLLTPPFEGFEKWQRCREAQKAFCVQCANTGRILAHRKDPGPSEFELLDEYVGICRCSTGLALRAETKKQVDERKETEAEEHRQLLIECRAKDICATCRGTQPVCWKCNGTGKFFDDSAARDDDHPDLCLNCKGTGLLFGRMPCKVCRGSGKTSQTAQGRRASNHYSTPLTRDDVPELF